MRVEKTFSVYVEMRTSGRTAISALDALRANIETLPPAECRDLVQRVKDWEDARRAAKTAARRSAQVTEAEAPEPAEEAVPELPPEPVLEAVAHDLAPTPAEPVLKPLGAGRPLCPRCGKPNMVGEVFCAHCGNFLKTGISLNQTTHLNQTNILVHPTNYFGESSTLILVVGKDKTSYHIQPQRLAHETVIGRSDGGTVKPDIDLSAHDAAVLGVSRLHVALNYNAESNLLSIADMKSANGTYINGQKLLPQEVRVLRDGDELRIGRLAVRAYFQHSDDSLVS